MNEFIDKTYGQALGLLAEKYGDREALVFGDRRFTFRDVKRQADLAAARLASLGLKPGDKVAIWLPNRPELLWYWLGAAATGVIAVILNTRLKQGEAAYQLQQSDSRAAIVPGDGAFRDFLGDLSEISPEILTAKPGELSSAALPMLRHVVACDPFPGRFAGVTDWSAPAPEDLPVPPYVTDPLVPAMIAYSSGTTALPKGAILTHVVWRKVADHGDRFRQTPDDRLYLAAPLFGIMASINGVLTFWSRGSCVILAERFDPDLAIKTLQDERCTAAYLLPVMVDELVKHPRRGEFDLSRLRTGIVLSTNAEILRMAAEQLGMRELFTSFGMTETSTAVTRTWWNDPLEMRLTSHGKPLPDIEVRVADPDTGEERPQGELGEIQVRGYCVTPGYYKKPEETARSFTSDGWFKTGDGGYYLEDGSLKFTSRLKDSYKHKGFNVSAVEVEAALMQHPDVQSAAVVGVPDRIHGEIGAAFLIFRPGCSATQEGVVAFVRPLLASFKVPHHVFFVEEFPATAGTGKVQKFQLKEMAMSRLGIGMPDQATKQKVAL